MQALQTLSQREFEMMQCFWEADEPLKMKELQTRWAHGETPQSRSTTLIYPFLRRKPRPTQSGGDECGIKNQYQVYWRFHTFFVCLFVYFRFGFSIPWS